MAEKDYPIVQYVPRDDLKTHVETGFDCHCRPVVIFVAEKEEVDVVHNSYDGREFFEGEMFTANISDLTH